MENIYNKFIKVYKWNNKHHGEIFLDRKYKDDLEWLLLGYFARMLKINKLPYPTYAVKRETPDFITYDHHNCLFAPIEITEILHPDRRRTEEYRQEKIQTEKFKKLSKKEQHGIIENAKGELQEPDLRGKWHGLFIETFKKKFNRAYSPNTWLLIYLNISQGHLSPHGGWWYLGMEWLANEFFFSDKPEYKHLKFPPFKGIYVIKSDGNELVQIYPAVELIQICQYKSMIEDWDFTNWDENTIIIKPELLRYSTVQVCIRILVLLLILLTIFVLFQKI